MKMVYPTFLSHLEFYFYRKNIPVPYNDITDGDIERGFTYHNEGCLTFLPPTDEMYEGLTVLSVNALSDDEVQNLECLIPLPESCRNEPCLLSDGEYTFGPISGDFDAIGYRIEEDETITLFLVKHVTVHQLSPVTFDSRPIEGFDA